MSAMQRSVGVSRSAAGAGPKVVAFGGGHGLYSSLSALRHLTAFGTQMVTNLEPVYSIVLAIVLLGEQHELDTWFYVGVAVILAAVFVHPLLNRKSRSMKQPELMGTAESHAMID